MNFKRGDLVQDRTKGISRIGIFEQYVEGVIAKNTSWKEEIWAFCEVNWITNDEYPVYVGRDYYSAIHEVEKLELLNTLQS